MITSIVQCSEMKLGYRIKSFVTDVRTMLDVMERYTTNTPAVLNTSLSRHWNYSCTDNEASFVASLTLHGTLRIVTEVVTMNGTPLEIEVIAWEFAEDGWWKMTSETYTYAESL